MKKYLILLAMAFMLPTQSDAQFFKKLGKALGEVGKAVLETAVSDATTSSGLSSTITTSNATLNNAIPKIDIDIIEAYHEGNGIIIRMTLTNTGNDTESFVFTGVNGQSFATEPSAYGDFSSKWKIGNHDWYHWELEYSESCWDYKLVHGAKIEALCYLDGISADVTKIKTMRFSARLGGTSFYVGQEEKIYTATIENLTVKSSAEVSSAR